MTSSDTAPAVPSKPAPRWPWWTFRILITVTAVLVFDQAVFAGQFLAGSYPSLLTHRDNARTATAAMFLSLVAAVLVRRPGRGPIRPLVASAVLFLLLGVQFALGFAHQLALHVPNGVAIIGLTVALAWWAWRTEPVAVTPPRTRLAELPLQSAPPAEQDAEVSR